ncbi:MAG TPA: tRNA uridine-5-carboxymethylaminomethyl(34) synthesis GTPase MnmE [Tepidisphaeraceae bacterium]|nr:tRNA uridine-5-carboxymethylaminomethyl(34) synthesis GTPase MnmE [Tepidisphaeraceae bacterium]
MNTSDTIAAISSAVGASARMIVRASGPLAREIHQHLTSESQFIAAAAKRGRICFSDLAFPAQIYTFASPQSATGEDVVEFHVPGNPLLARLLLEELIRRGARQAEPGEFTARAYFNGRIDLTAAEGVAATISAQNQQQLHAARQLMSGELAHRLRPMLDALVETLALVEAGIDFSEEDISFLTKTQIAQRLTQVDASLTKLISQSARFERLSHEPRVVLVGRPNAGKSTLLNALCGYDRAVVSPHAGTTRDAIWAQVDLPRGAVRMIDVAGLDASSDEISQAMQQHARRAIEEADIVVLVRDCTDDRPPIDLPRKPNLHIASKSDLKQTNLADELPVSAMNGTNLDRLRNHLDDLAFGQSTTGATLALNARHLQSIEQARDSLARAQQTAAPEILAMELREALNSLGQVLGIVTPDDVLGKVFATFCIGK